MKHLNWPIEITNRYQHGIDDEFIWSLSWHKAAGTWGGKAGIATVESPFGRRSNGQAVTRQNSAARRREGFSRALQQCTLPQRRLAALPLRRAASTTAAAALRVVHGGHEPNVVLLYRLARQSPGAQRQAARIAAAAPQTARRNFSPRRYACFA